MIFLLEDANQSSKLSLAFEMICQGKMLCTSHATYNILVADFSY